MWHYRISYLKVGCLSGWHLLKIKKSQYANSICWIQICLNWHSGKGLRGNMCECCQFACVNEENGYTPWEEKNPCVWLCNPSPEIHIYSRESFYFSNYSIEIKWCECHNMFLCCMLHICRGIAFLFLPCRKKQMYRPLSGAAFCLARKRL